MFQRTLRFPSPALPGSGSEGFSHPKPESFRTPSKKDSNKKAGLCPILLIGVCLHDNRGWTFGGIGTNFIVRIMRGLQSEITIMRRRVGRP
jgi:hypothetical protein